jgi:hypothetical protein
MRERRVRGGGCVRKQIWLLQVDFFAGLCGYIVRHSFPSQLICQSWISA